MRITKLGHCAMIVECDGVRLLTDPGNYYIEAQNAVTGIHGVLVTHEHADHLHVDSLKAILANNPTAVVVGNSAVAKVVGESIADTVVIVVGDGQSTDINGVLVEGFGTAHEPIYQEFGLVENTGYLVGKTFYFPGDAFHPPDREVDVLALPVAGPWMKVSQAIDFAKAVRPRVAFGVHDGMIKPSMHFAARMAPTLLKDSGIEYVTLADGETREF